MDDDNKPELVRAYRPYQLVSPWPAAGDQPNAVAQLTAGLAGHARYQTLLGITGSGKSFTIASAIAAHGRPALVLAPNKSLAAQLFTELKAFLPHNRVEYFVSYYDYYQPEAYMPASDTYIEKSSVVNDEIDRLRHSATSALLTRTDTVVVASVSAVYGLGDPRQYLQQLLVVRTGQVLDRDDFLGKLIAMRYDRNDLELARGRIRVRGDVVEIVPSWSEERVRVDLFGDEVTDISVHDSLGQRVRTLDEVVIPPATHYATEQARVASACVSIETELAGRLAELENVGNLVEAQRLRVRVSRDLEMLRNTGWCSGVENYSAPMEGRAAGVRPFTLLDYFPDRFVVVVDESHVSVPQLRGAYGGDRSRKEVLVAHGFRLPSAMDNRPLKFEEVLDVVDSKSAQVMFVSATPGEFELDASSKIVEQIVRPTGLLDPHVEVRSASGQATDLLAEIRCACADGQRTLVTTLTKRMAEELTDWLAAHGVKVRYLHSGIDTIERIELVRNLRLGEFDVLVGINLLREGLDLPEVGLVAVLDADKEGFLRSRTSLLQTIGRAARNVDGRVLLYAEKVTASMRAAMDETARRRSAQALHNEQHGIVPATIIKPVTDILAIVGISRPTSSRQGKTQAVRRVPAGGTVDGLAALPPAELCAELERRMLHAAERLDFETAAELRDLLVAVGSSDGRQLEG
jgi:excinuclease ABC subunit B